MGTINPKEMKDCDGLDVTAMPMGTNFPHGMAAFHLGTNVGAQFGFYNWSDIATGLSLATPCDAHRPGVTSTAFENKKKLSPSIHQQSQNFLYHRNKILLKNFPAAKGIVTITLYDLRGNQVVMLFTDIIDRGEVAVPFILDKVHSGTYLVKCSSNNRNYTGKLLKTRQ
jgi:hypothetical protein